MNALFLNRHRSCPWIGGDQVQEDTTAWNLRKMGVGIIQSDDTEPYFDGANIVHLFNLIGFWTLHQFRAAKRYGIPIAISTIYNPGQYDDVSYEDQKEMVCGASVLLPNSVAEAERLKADFGDIAPCRVIHNGVPHSILPPLDISGERGIAMFAGRFDERKRVLELVKAWRDPRLSHIPLIMCGHTFLSAYCEEVRQVVEADQTENIFYAGQVEFKKLFELYAQARVFVLPSRLETPGLANLEAASMGCNLVAGDCPYVREYFGDHATYVDGSDPSAIVEAVLANWDRPANQEISTLVRTKYTWEGAAKATLAAYEAVAR